MYSASALFLKLKACIILLFEEYVGKRVILSDVQFPFFVLIKAALHFLKSEDLILNFLTLKSFPIFSGDGALGAHG